MRQHHRKDEDWGARGVFALRIATVLTVLAVVALGATGVSHEDRTAPPPRASAPQNQGAAAPAH